MPTRLSMPNLPALLILAAALGAQAQIGVTSIRQPGASLDLSLRNEADHAVRQADAWLRAQQNADGSWGTSNRVRLTSLAVLALAAASQPNSSEPATRAALWLDTHAAAPLNELDTCACLLLALSRVLPETPARTNLLRRIAAAAAPLEPRASAEARLFWAEAQAGAGLAPFPPVPAAARARLAELARRWPPPLPDNAAVWPLARLVNQAGGGQLVRDNAPLDWRRDLARRLFGTQRSAPAGGGFWDAPDPDAKLAETAFGLLALLEL